MILYPADISANGDVNLDSNTDIFDALLVVDIVLSLHTPSDAELQNSDLNQDQNIDIYDITSLVDIILGNVISGDGEIVFQYKEVYNVDDHGVTIGIESPSKDEGVQYIFNQSLELNAEPVESLSQSKGIRFYVP